MNFLKKSMIFLCAGALSLNVAAADFSKKEVKQISKAFKEYEKGKIFKKNDRIAPVGLNLNFRVAAKQSQDTSWKSKTWTKFDAVAILEGVDDAVFQDITNEYQKMVFKRLEDMGMTVVGYDEIKAAKSYPKLAQDGTASGEETAKKNWGVEKQFIPEGQEVAVWYKAAAPFGPHRKIPKELDAILFNSFVRIDFAEIGIEISEASTLFSSHELIYTSGKASVVPAISIEKDTMAFAAAKKGEHNLQIWTDEDASKLDVISPLVYAASIDDCKSDCNLGFSTKGFLKSNNIQTVKIVADPEKYKKAVLDALDKYLDKQFTLYANVRSK